MRPKGYGCYNRKAYKPYTVVQNGYWLDGTSMIPKVEKIPFRMTPDCQYTHTDLGKVDERCVGCKHKVDVK